MLKYVHNLGWNVMMPEVYFEMHQRLDRWMVRDGYMARHTVKQVQWKWVVESSCWVYSVCCKVHSTFCILKIVYTELLTKFCSFVFKSRPYLLGKNVEEKQLLFFHRWFQGVCRSGCMDHGLYRERRLGYGVILYLERSHLSTDLLLALLLLCLKVLRLFPVCLFCLIRAWRYVWHSDLHLSFCLLYCSESWSPPPMSVLTCQFIFRHICKSALDLPQQAHWASRQPQNRTESEESLER